jgi:hypothetical protein
MNALRVVDTEFAQEMNAGAYPTFNAQQTKART